MKAFVNKYHVSLLFVFLGVGVLVRFLAATTGFTYDMESYQIAARAVLEHKNVYAETVRYNYGPFWFYVLAILYKLALLFPDPFFALRYFTAGVLALVDIGLFFLLSSLFSRTTAYLYYLNPISILVTGYYSQFDNLALLAGLAAVWLLARKRKISGLALLGVSLIIKHIFFFFPVWLAIREKTWKGKLVTVGLPTGIFLLSFLPFLRDGFEGIIQNVFLYTSFNNAPFWHVFVPDFLSRYVSPMFLFVFALTLGGVFARRISLTQLAAWYGCILVLFSPAISEQYFVLTLPLLSQSPNIFFSFFVVLQTLFMLLVMSGGDYYVPFIGIRMDRQMFGLSWQIVFLGLGLGWLLWGKRFKKLTVRELSVVSIAALLALLIGFWIPSAREDQIVASIETALARGDYETANRLYDRTQVNPPFAGSRFWNKLTKARYHIEYYRNFVKARDLYKNAKREDSWEDIKKLLRKMPINFPFRREVEEMLKEAEART